MTCETDIAAHTGVRRILGWRLIANCTVHSLITDHDKRLHGGCGILFVSALSRTVTSAMGM